MDPCRADGSLITVGDRLVCDEDIGTVRFTGNIPSTKGCWIGIEWDDPSRGKHDGQHNGVNYFKTSLVATRPGDFPDYCLHSHSTGGSFVRPKKVDGGISCFSAIQNRYGEIEDENSGVVTEELFVVDKNNKRTMVEMVGAKSVNLKQSQLNRLKEVVLRDMAVYGVGQHADELKQKTPNIIEIDLSRNLLTTWQSVANITKCLPRLRGLNVRKTTLADLSTSGTSGNKNGGLSHLDLVVAGRCLLLAGALQTHGHLHSDNKLGVPDNPSELIASFKDLSVLYLNRMNYTWEQILTVVSMFRSLVQLHVCFNSLQSLRPVTGDVLQHLTLLNLESNNINKWSDVMHFSTLPRLEELILNDNEVMEIAFTDAGPTEKTKHFLHLKCLCICHNKLSDWSSIDELNKLQSLEELRFTHNPLLNMTKPETARQLIIAKISKLKLCNRTEVTEDERKGAEIDYLKRFGPDWLKSGGRQDSRKTAVDSKFIHQHPIYQELIKDYGAPENSEMAQKSKTLKDNLINVFLSSPYAPDKGTLQKKLPVTMSVTKLKTLVKRLFKLEDVIDIYLSYQSHKNPRYPEIEFENDLRSLSFYSVESGDTILVRYR